MQKLLKYIEKIGFSPKNGAISSWSKSYNGYEITISYDESNPAASTINYGKKIKAGRKTTCDFHQTESLVVLECVNRLLEKGYNPEDIELEKVWSLGHKGKGFLDILVKNKNQSFLMIECKVWGKDFETEIKNTLNRSKKGCQIFSYLQQEPKTTKAIALYSYNPETTEYKTAIIYNHADWADLNQEDRYNRWLGKFEDNGIFEDWVSAYSLQSKAITKKDLKALTKEDGDNIYNKFAEILRHNVISDKSNAFNKIINLFLCKIYDEDNTDDTELKFQTRRGTEEKSDEDLLLDLSDLYMSGMKYYLNKEIEDVTLEEFQSLATRAKNDELMKAYLQLRLYKDNVFGFREVFDKQSFKDNSKVVREVVELLQDKRLRYSHKQQFLGDFFENLLKDSIKQESGQFFTPVPITQFIINSLPIHEIIQKNITDKSDDILPYTIDYAMGSGHFLTEIMDEYNKVVKQINVDSISKKSVKEDVGAWKIKEFAWAQKYVYGIDLDYRLVKTSKIACFLNGDGLANVIHADGLDSFYKSKAYKDKLLTKKKSLENEQFDVLISNPPYSVKAFKNTVNDGENSFELFKYLTDNSSEIECLFVERAKQLLREGAVIAIVLPVSVLTNGGIYEKTRELLLKYFEFKAILALGMQAFAATNTKTIILFMKRRSNFAYSEIENVIDEFFINHKDIAVNGIPKAITKYISSVYEDLTLNDYIDLISGKITDKLRDSEIYKEYKTLSNNEIVKIERDKLLYFALTNSQKIVLANSKDKDEEKSFYGYEFSNRRGHEGIQIRRDENDIIKTKLFEPNNRINPDKLNSYILKSYNNIDVENDIESIKLDDEHPLHGHIDYMNLSDLITFDAKTFDKALNINSKKKIKINSRYPIEKLSNIVSYYSSGVVYDKNDVSNYPSKFAILPADNISINNTLEINKIVYLKDNFRIDPLKKLSKNDVFICLSSGSLKHIGKVAFISKNTEYYAGGFMGIIRANDKIVTPKYLFDILSYKSVKNNMETIAVGNNINNLGAAISKLTLPVPPIDIQNKIVKELEKLETDEQNHTSSIVDKKNKIEFLLNKLYSEAKSNIRLRDTDVFDISIGKRVLKKDLVNNGKIPVYSANVFEPFGFVNKSLFIDFFKPSVLWGIDGDWLVNHLPNNIEFYPTDHCGVLRIKNENKIDSKYLAYALKKEGNKLGFSRTKRASIDRIQNIKIPLPDFKQQQDVASIVTKLENDIESSKKILDDISEKKQIVLDKYLK